MVITLIGLDL